MVGIDNLNNYYDTNLKYFRLKILKFKNFSFNKIDLLEEKNLKIFLKKTKFKK